MVFAPCRFVSSREASGKLAVAALKATLANEKASHQARIAKGSVELRDVTFTYPDSKHPALRSVSFAIEPGDRVGIIGRIGSGKTTIGRLLVGFYEPDQGAVLVDGTDLRQYHPADVRRGIGLVMQDVMLFQGTVRDNIALGAPQADDAMILRAAQLAGVDTFVGNHPLGYDLPVGERGQLLSGGQRQAVALARALLMDPPILMLDEPTSAMDYASERQFVRRLGSVLSSGRTLIVTTHRGSLLQVVNRLVVLEDGGVKLDGPRDQVMAALRGGPQPVSASEGEEEPRRTVRAAIVGGRRAAAEPSEGGRP